MAWNVLCISETPSRLLLYRSRLELEGHSVLLAADTDDAVWLCRMASIDCIVMDHQKDGGMLTSEIASVRPEVPIVFVSGETRIPLQIYPLVEMFLSIDEAVERIAQCVEEAVGRPARASKGRNKSDSGICDAKHRPLHNALVRWILPW